MDVKMNSFDFVNAEPQQVLKTVFGYDTFRSHQLDIINSVLSGHDTLAVMPTGGGKSICYQIPALIFPGITIVISPLISLMQDQVASLRATGIQALFLNSSLSWEEYKDSVNDIKSGLVKVVYLSPEGLATGRIRDLISSPEITVSLIAVDEAHCVSNWGHDFRPDYLEISSVRHLIPNTPMLALTATATERVRLDIAQNLNMQNPALFISSFNRSNIYLEVQRKINGLGQVIEYIKNRKEESGIIYCYSRKQVDELTASLDKLGFSVLNYHAGLPDNVRAKNQDLFIKDDIQIMVATVAFGMGIDKPNVRYVINYDLPSSLEEYYQEIGRAGRDGLPSSALLLYSAGDIHKIRYFFNESADPEKAENLLQGMLSYANARVCRRKALLSYFGEVYPAPGEQAPSDEDKKCCCDICNMNNIPLVDVTIPTQKLLCCIIRTNQRFGATYVIDVLLGSRNKRILENKHDKLSTWGIGHEYTKEQWLELVDLLLIENYIVKTGEFNVLQITPNGKSLLVARNQLQLPMRLTNFKSLPKKSHSHNGYDKVAEKPAIDDTMGDAIVVELRKWRKRKAEDMNVPPYVIFGDKTLLDLAAKKPKSKTDLLKVYGIGTAKAEEFGNSIIQITSKTE